MSNLLEEAIIDAKALKEAAMKTAEKSIVEKYSDEVKSQINKILENEMDLDNATSDNPLEKIPLAALDGEVDTDSDEEIEIDLSDLADKAAQEEVDIEDMEPTELSLGQLAQAADAEDEDLADLDAGDEAIGDEEDIQEEDLINMIVSALQEESAEEVVEETKEEEINEEEAKIKAEEMKTSDQHKMPPMVDTEPMARAGEIEEERIKEEDSEVKEDDDKKKDENLNLANEFTKLQESINTLGRDNKTLKTSNAKIVEENSDLKDTLRSLNEVFEDLLLQNAQLVYTNKVLEVSSLNERQKEKIVGAIRESKSAEEAKVVFETLQNAVGRNKNKGPQSLNEVFSKNSTKTISRKETDNDNQMPVSTRWKTLAGIK